MTLREPIQWQRVLSSQPRAFGEVAASAVLRQSPGDFRVDENPGFEFTGTGDHLCLQLEKTGLNTIDVVQRLVQALKVKPVDIGYFGLKDRVAVTTQWFTVHLPGKSPPAISLDTGSEALGSGIRILTSTRHHRKIKTGSHKSNCFEITLREFEGERAGIESRAQQVLASGFPNYFGEQRFGLGARNLEKALSLFQSSASGQRPRGSRHQRGLYLSAARGFLFNQVLAERIRAGNWLTAATDEWLVLDGTRSYFMHDGEEDVAARLEQLDLHTSGPLWGRGAAINPSERMLVSPYRMLATGLEEAGMTAARRALRVAVSGTSLEFKEERSLTLGFELPAGAYATSLLRELVNTRPGTSPAPD